MSSSQSPTLAGADFSGALGEDVKRAARALRRTDSGYARRTYVRTVFAEFEGLTNLFKTRTVAEAKRERVELTQAELLALNEETYTVDRSGKVVIQPRFFPLTDSFAFSVNIFARVLGIQFRVHTKSKGWNALILATRVRNRITHPKAQGDLEITDDELGATYLAHIFVNYTCNACLLEESDKKQSALNELASILEQHGRKPFSKSPAGKLTDTALAKIRKRTARMGKVCGIET